LKERVLGRDIGRQKYRKVERERDEIDKGTSVNIDRGRESERGGWEEVERGEKRKK